MPNMDAKHKYREQLKLQAALTRVVQVLARFQRDGLQLNVNNLGPAVGVMQLLDVLAGVPFVRASRALRREDFDPLLLTIAGGVIVRRRKETKARRRRRRRAK
jgi:hypothetical protein